MATQEMTHSTALATFRFSAGYRFGVSRGIPLILAV